MEYGWERYQRQLGLVYQERIARLRVLFVGDDPALSSALVCFALLGAGTIQNGALCICRRPRDLNVTPRDVEAQSLLKTEDIGKDYELWLQHRLAEVNRDVRSEVVEPTAIGTMPDVVIVLGNSDTWHGPGERVIYGRTGRVALAMGSGEARHLRSIRDIGQTNILTGSCWRACLAHCSLRRRYVSAACCAQYRLSDSGSRRTSAWLAARFLLSWILADSVSPVDQGRRPRSQIRRVG